MIKAINIYCIIHFHSGPRTEVVFRPSIIAASKSSTGPKIVFQGNGERDDSFILFMIWPKYEPWKSPVFSRFMKKKILNDPNVMLLNV